MQNKTIRHNNHVVFVGVLHATHDHGQGLAGSGFICNDAASDSRCSNPICFRYTKQWKRSIHADHVSSHFTRHVVAHEFSKRNCLTFLHEFKSSYLTKSKHHTWACTIGHSDRVTSWSSSLVATNKRKIDPCLVHIGEFELPRSIQSIHELLSSCLGLLLLQLFHLKQHGHVNHMAHPSCL